MIECVIYARYSPRPGESGSIETQYQECEQFAKANGWRVLGKHGDEHKSGADPERPGLWDAMEQTPKGGVLLVWKMDRLARDLYLAEALHRHAEKHGFKIQAAREGVQDDTAEGRLIRQVLSAAAEYERRLVQVRTSVAMRRYQSEGRRMSRHPPYGWMLCDADPSRLQLNQSEQQAIDKMLEWREAGYGWRSICDLLNRNGFAPRGKAWDPSSVRRICTRTPERRGENLQP